MDNEDERPLAADLYRLARETAEARAELTAQYDDIILGISEGAVWTAPEIAQYQDLMATDREMFQDYLEQARRWQAGEPLSAYQQAVLAKLLADGAAGLEQIERLARLIPDLPTAPRQGRQP